MDWIGWLSSGGMRYRARFGAKKEPSIDGCSTVL